MATQTYSFRNNNVIVAGEFMTAFFEGSDAISAQRLNDRSAMKTGADGDTTHVESLNNQGELMIRLKADSPSNSYLNDLANNQTTFNCSIVDKNSNALQVSAENCRVANNPQVQLGDDMTVREYKINAGNIVFK